MRTVQTQNFVKILKAVFEIWTKNIKNAPKMGVFPHLRPPKIFFQKSGSVTFVPLWCTNFMQKIKKILRAVSEIFKDGLRTTDYGPRTTDMGDYIGPSRVNPGSKIIYVSKFIPNYPHSYLGMHATDTILLIQQLIIITRAHVEFQPN